MHKPDYQKLDAAIIARLQAGPRFLHMLWTGDVKKEAAALETADKSEYRFVDGRLQALRKLGMIEYSGKTGWSLKTKDGK